MKKRMFFLMSVLGGFLVAGVYTAAPVLAEPRPDAPRCDLKAVQGEMVHALEAHLGQLDISVISMKTHLQGERVISSTQRYELYTSIDGTMVRSLGRNRRALP